MAARRVAVVGDYDPKNHTHQATDAGLTHARIDYEWVLTSDVDPRRPSDRLGRYGGVVIAPSSPYVSMDGALAAIRYARERGVPLVGT
jgi:CTP synthase (UTP-ammonia lyase)